MISAWTQHLPTNEEKVRFASSVQSAKPVLDRIKAILLQDELALDRSETDIKTFDSPNWSHKQAYKNGYRKAIQMITTLVDLDQQQLSKN